MIRAIIYKLQTGHQDTLPVSPVFTRVREADNCSALGEGERVVEARPVTARSRKVLEHHYDGIGKNSKDSWRLLLKAVSLKGSSLEPKGSIEPVRPPRCPWSVTVLEPLVRGMSGTLRVPIAHGCSGKLARIPLL